MSLLFTKLSRFLITFLPRSKHLLILWLQSLSVSSVTQLCLTLCDLMDHGLQQARPPCPSPTPGAYWNSCPLSWWCHPTISSSVVPVSSCPQSFSASGSFPVSQFFASGGWSVGVSASASVLPMNIQGWFPLGLTGLINLQSKSFLQHHSSKASILRQSAFFTVTFAVTIVWIKFKYTPDNKKLVYTCIVLY